METSFAEFSNVVTPKPINEWDSGPAMIDLPRPDGSNVNLVFSSYIRARDHVLHIHNEQDGIEFDTPTDGDFNLMLHSNENGRLVPLAAASISMENDIPTITMIQRVTARVKQDGVPPPEPNGLIKIEAIYNRIQHPRADLLQGDNKIEWQKALLQQCEQVVKHQGFKTLRLRSGFNSKYAPVGHNLSLAVQQYDYMVNNMDEWIPVDSQNQPITEPEQRQELGKVIKRVRDKKIQTIAEVKQQYQSLQIPFAWQKAL